MASKPPLRQARLRLRASCFTLPASRLLLLPPLPYFGNGTSNSTRPLNLPVVPLMPSS